MIRAFIAIHVPEWIRHRLSQVQQELQRGLGPQAVRWAPLDQMHLTLRFLGHIPDESVSPLIEALLPVAAAASGIHLGVCGLGAFPSVRQPRVLWAGLSGAVEALQHLQRQVAEASSTWGEPEEREFHPHVTLGRVKELRSRESRQLSSLVEARSAQPFGDWPVTDFHLMQSQLSPRGATHRSIRTFPLANPSR